MCTGDIFQYCDGVKRTTITRRCIPARTAVPPLAHCNNVQTQFLGNAPANHFHVGQEAGFVAGTCRNNHYTVHGVGPGMFFYLHCNGFHYNCFGTRLT